MVITQPILPTPIPYPPATPVPQGAATPRRLVGSPRPDRAAAVATAPSAPKEIATLPPLPVLRYDMPLPKRTGEPPRPRGALMGSMLFCLTAAAMTAVYARRWWLAVYPNTYSSSTYPIQWVAPAPGEWPSLTLRGVLALLPVPVASVCAVVDYQAWTGWSWARVISVASLTLTGVAILLFNLWALAGIGLALLGTVCVFLPDTTRYFRYSATHRAKLEETYRTPGRILYGCLPRFR